MTDITHLIERVEKCVTWRAVPDWAYEASNTGLLRNAQTKHILKLQVNHGGYLQCMFQTDKVRRTVRVHRAIVEAWIGSIPTGMQINHIDGNKKNNRIDNLEIVTPEENMRHAVKMKLTASGDRNNMRINPSIVPRGSKSYLAKLTECDVLLVRKRLAKGEMQTVIARDYGVTKHTIWQIKERRTWTHI